MRLQHSSKHNKQLAAVAFFAFATAGPCKQHVCALLLSQCPRAIATALGCQLNACLPVVALAHFCNYKNLIFAFLHAKKSQLFCVQKQKVICSCVNFCKKIFEHLRKKDFAKLIFGHSKNLQAAKKAVRLLHNAHQACKACVSWLLAIMFCFALRKIKRKLYASFGNFYALAYKLRLLCLKPVSFRLAKIACQFLQKLQNFCCCFCRSRQKQVCNFALANLPSCKSWVLQNAKTFLSLQPTGSAAAATFCACGAIQFAPPQIARWKR